MHKATHTLKILKEFNPLPSPSLPKKIDFFYSPYNRKVLGFKHMDFEEKERKIVSKQYELRKK